MLTINISEVIWTIFNFFLLYFLLKTFLYNPIVNFMDERNARIKKGMDAQKAAMDAIAEHEAQLGEKIAAANTEAAKLISDGRTSDAARRNATLNAARTKAADKRKELNEKSVAECEKELAQIKADGDELAAVLAARLLERG